MKTGTTRLATFAALLVMGINNQAIINPTTIPGETSTMNLGKHYIALAVNDIVASKEFYEKLGFTIDPGCGDIKQRWIMMNNGDIMIGLYQGMFPKNIITFNPTDARTLHKNLQDKGVKFDMVQDIEKESGPCSFALTDPDGNPVLVDQHF